MARSSLPWLSERSETKSEIESRADEPGFTTGVDDGWLDLVHLVVDIPHCDGGDDEGDGEHDGVDDGTFRVVFA